MVVNYFWLILFILIIPDLSNEFQHIKILYRYSYSYITLKIDGFGNKRVYTGKDWKCDNKNFIPPDEIYINEINQITIKNEYNFSESKNTVKLVWFKEMNSTACLFRGCVDIKEIDFSHFNSSLITGEIKSMFNGCNSLVSLDLSGFNTSKVTGFPCLFCNCYSLTSINLTNFDTSNIFNMENMFNLCYSLESINLSSFNTPSLKDVKGMFYNCNNLTFIDLSHFDFSNIINMANMFQNCTSLITVKFPNSTTPNLIGIGSMFQFCYSLLSVDLSNFDTSQVICMDRTFRYCRSLTSINLSNFDTSKVTWMESMFEGCSNLEYINFKNAKDNNVNACKYDNIFRGTPDNLVMCINETNSPNITKIFKKKTEGCPTIDCSENLKSNQKKIKTGLPGCAENCTNHMYYIYEFNGRCYDTYDYGIFFDEKDLVQKCKCKYDKCLSCSNVELVKDLCITCNKSYYPKENDETNLGPYINCYKDIDGYYLDTTDNNNYIYKLCYHTCKTCKIRGDYFNHNCIECNSNYSFSIANNNNYSNCYKNCDYYYFFDDLGNFNCTSDYNCPLEFSKLQVNKSECIKNCSLDDTNKLEFRNKCYDKCPEESIEINGTEYHYCEALCNKDYPFLIHNTQECVEFCTIEEILSNSCELKYIEDTNVQEEGDNRKNITEKEIEKLKEIKIKDKMLESIEKDFIRDTYNKTEIEQGNDAYIKYKEFTITLTTTENQRKNKNKDKVTLIDICDCEYLLRQAYNISPSEKLFMRKVDIEQEGMNIPKIEYDVYSRLNGSDLIKLNLSFCKDSKVDYYIPTILSDNIDKYNISSNYYNDICYTATSESGADIIIRDRQNEFMEGNKTVCQENCELADYNNNKVKCTCDVEESSSSSEFMNINKTKLFEKFIDIKNLVNINLLVCYKVLFSKKGIIKNIGSDVCSSDLLFLLLFYILFVLYYSLIHN